VSGSSKVGNETLAGCGLTGVQLTGGESELVDSSVNRPAAEIRSTLSPFITGLFRATKGDSILNRHKWQKLATSRFDLFRTATQLGAQKSATVAEELIRENLMDIPL
jgi:hypothetical protein